MGREVWGVLEFGELVVRVHEGGGGAERAHRKGLGEEVGALDRRLAVSRSGQTELDGVEHEGEVDAVVAEPRVDVAAPDERDAGMRELVGGSRTRACGYQRF